MQSQFIGLIYGSLCPSRPRKWDQTNKPRFKLKWDKYVLPIILLGWQTPYFFSEKLIVYILFLKHKYLIWRFDLPNQIWNFRRSNWINSDILDNFFASMELFKIRSPNQLNLAVHFGGTDWMEVIFWINLQVSIKLDCWLEWNRTDDSYLILPDLHKLLIFSRGKVLSMPWNKCLRQD